jgi:Ion channel
VHAARLVVYLFSLSTVLDCLSVPSLVMSSGRQWLNFNFLQAYSGVLIEWALLEKHDIVRLNYPTLARLQVSLVLQLVSFLFITSCGIQQLEMLDDPGEQLASQNTWANAVYFANVTLVTVGYGDILPYTLMGRMWIVFHIILTAYLVSREISLLIDTLKSMRRGDWLFFKFTVDTHVSSGALSCPSFSSSLSRSFPSSASTLTSRLSSSRLTTPSGRTKTGTSADATQNKRTIHVTSRDVLHGCNHELEAEPFPSTPRNIIDPGSAALAQGVIDKGDERHN